MTEYRIKRAYEPAEDSDGLRILVDRLWPRGIKKENLHAQWFKDIAPSPALRKEWGHDPDRLDWFEQAYTSELDELGDDVLSRWDDLVGDADLVTLVYAAKDPHVNHARILRDWLTDRARA
jgi:uncharacterized protein YeaO (DUF488 family)